MDRSGKYSCPMSAKMMGTIRGILVILTCLLLAGCSMRKQSTYERTASHAHAAGTAKHERQLRQHEQTTVASIRMAYANSVAELIPVGTFRLSADSGYVGRAARVVIHQNSAKMQVAKSDAVVSAVDSARIMAATREYTAQERDTRMEHRKADVSPLWKIPWWVWLCAVGVVIYLFRRLRKR